MAIKAINRTQWTGLSTDVKPTVATSSEVELLDQFYETNTGDNYITYDGTNWTKITAAANIPAITSGAGAPVSTPVKVGDIYVDTTGKKLYFAAGLTSAADWVLANV